MKEIKTNNGKKGGWLVGKRHYDQNGKPLGGIKAVVTDAGGKPVELEGGEVIINREASKKHWKELSRINQSAGGGVPIGPPAGADEDPEEYKEGGRVIDFNPNHIPNKWILSYAKNIKSKHPEIWDLGGNIFGNEAFENLKRVAERGHWLDSEEWMYIKWRSYVARHIHDFRIEGVIAMLKWVDKVEKGWPYMKQLIEEKIKKIESKKKGWKHKMKEGGKITHSFDLKLKNIDDAYKVIVEKNKEVIGELYFIESKFKPNLIATSVSVDPNYRRKGIASSMYVFAEKKLGKSFLKNENVLTPDGKALWGKKNREFGKHKMKEGGSVAQTPAPKKDRIKGSDINKPGSSASTKSASSIKFDESTIESIKSKVKEHNQKHPNKKITLASAKAVVRRGMGAYSSSHRPTIGGGKPNDRTAWGLARLNAFTYKIVHGKSKSGKYTQDDDLINELGYSVSKMKHGGNIEYQSRDLNGTMVYYKRKLGSKWEFISKEEFEKNADEMNTVKFKDGGELAKGIKTEQEHRKTLEGIASGKYSVDEAIKKTAKDHLKEDPHYYSKLAQMEGKKYATGGLIISGVEVNIGDTVKIKAKGVPNGRRIKITNITDKWVIFTDLADGKRKDNARDAFLKNFIEKEGAVSTPTQSTLTSSKPNLNTLTDKEKDFLITKVLKDLSEYIKQDAGFIDPEYALQSFVTSIQDEGYEVDLPLDETIQKRIFIFLSLKDLLFTTKDGETKDKKISSDEAFKLMNPKASQSIDEKFQDAIKKFNATLTVGDLPLGLLLRAQENQRAQGNKPTFSALLNNDVNEKNFNWDKSPEGDDFWQDIFDGNWESKAVMSVMGSKEAFFEAPASTVSTPKTIDLRETKIRINSEEESKLFQEFAFKQGAKWLSDPNDVSYTEKPFLYLDTFLNFTYGDSEYFFNNSKDREITFQELGLKNSLTIESSVHKKEIQTHQHKDETEIKSERDLLIDEYNDITFLISITPSTDVDNMLALKQQSKELKDKLDTLDLELKKKIDGEVNLLENLFKASTVKPQERYQFKPYNDGFAPNGQPTELPKNIYDWTMTEEFINWFGNFTTAYNYKNSGYLNTPCSVVVNKNYEPLIVYHGTGSEFSFFKFDKFPAMYFAENVDYSNWFAEIKGSETGTNGYIYPFFLNIRTPLDLTHFKIDDVSPQDFIDWMFLQTGLDEDELKINKALLNPNGKYKAWMFLRNSPEMLQVLRDKNVCDGIIYYEDNPSVDKTSSAYQTKAYIVFNSNSAKIADPSRDKLTVSAMRSFYLKKGGKV